MQEIVPHQLLKGRLGGYPLASAGLQQRFRGCSGGLTDSAGTSSGPVGPIGLGSQPVVKVGTDAELYRAQEPNEASLSPCLLMIASIALEAFLWPEGGEGKSGSELTVVNTAAELRIVELSHPSCCEKEQDLMHLASSFFPKSPVGYRRKLGEEEDL